MTNSSIVLLCLAFIVAVAIGYFQYIYKVKTPQKYRWVLAFLRFMSCFTILLLLINPLIKRSTYRTDKVALPVVFDNSKSVDYLGQRETQLKMVKILGENAQLAAAYDVSFYQFDSEMKGLDVLDFKGTASKLELVGKELQSMFKNQAPAIVLTDGNQSSGVDFTNAFGKQLQVFPVVIGDTTFVFDLKTDQLIANSYVFYKNKFPLQVFVSSNTSNAVKAQIKVSQNGRQIAQKEVVFTEKQTALDHTFILDANALGKQTYEVSIHSSLKEKNTINNSKKIVVEVVDQRSEIAVISAILHPDLGALKRSLSTNEQRKIHLLKPSEVSDISKYDAVVLYQPNATFSQCYDQIEKAGKNAFVIAGTQTDYKWLVQKYPDLQLNMSTQIEEYQASYAADFGLFSQENIGFEKMPELRNTFGTYKLTSNFETLLYQRIRSNETQNPLLTFYSAGAKKTAFWFGEDFWKWSVHAHSTKENAVELDQMMDKILQFVLSTDRKKRLQVSSEFLYNANEELVISAQYFNQIFEFEEQAKLKMKLTKVNDNKVHYYDFSKTTASYFVNLSDLTAGNYAFEVQVMGTNFKHQGSFEVLPHDVEQHFVNPNVGALKVLAQQTKGAVYYPNQIEELIKFLCDADIKTPVQKLEVKKTPLIEWQLLLCLLILCLGTEWFIRKYQGLL